MFQKIVKLLYCFVFYNLDNTKYKNYSYFLKDFKKKNPHKISLQFYEDLTGVSKKIIDYDLQSYRIRGNNNSVQLSFETLYSQRTIERFKTLLIDKLHNMVQNYLKNTIINQCQTAIIGV